MKDKTEEIVLDDQILQRGAICMYHKLKVIEKDIEWFNNNRYQIVNMDASNWSPENVFKNIMKSFGFDGYGENLDAFEDYLDDLRKEKYRGLLLVFRGMGQLADKDKHLCEGILDVIAGTSRRWLVSGQRLICLLQSDNPDLYFEKIGGYNPSWNWQEWFDDKRKGN